MENKMNPSPEGYIDVRYNRIYPICLLLSGIAFFLIWTLLSDNQKFIKEFFLIFGLLLFVYGINAITSKRYFRYDPNGRKIKFYEFWTVIRSVEYDKLFFRGKDLYREINGKTRYINLARYQCNKKDLDILFKEINKE